MMGITKRQSELYDYLKRRLAADGRAPSMSEMAAELGCAKSNAQRCLKALEERGVIRRLPHKARAIEIVNLGHPVNLNREVHRLAEQYAKSESITVETACNEALRAYFGGVR